MTYTYFVSYEFSNQDNSGQGFGNVVLSRSTLVETAEHIGELKTLVTEQLMQSYNLSANVVILNFQLLKHSEY